MPESLSVCCNLQTNWHSYICHTKPLGKVSKNLFLIICFALHLELTASAPYFINYNNKYK